MAQTVTECLTAATDSVTLITDINSNGSSSDRVAVGVTQAEIYYFALHSYRQYA
jgi:hypothetical protein